MATNCNLRESRDARETVVPMPPHCVGERAWLAVQDGAANPVSHVGDRGDTVPATMR